MSARDDSRAAAYLLGELDADEAAAFEAALSRDAELRATVERLTPIVRQLEQLPDQVWEPVEPPPLREVEVAPTRRPRRLALRPVVAVAYSLVVLLAGIVLGVLLDGDDSEAPGATRIALEPIDAGRGASGTVDVIDEDSQMRLRVSGLDRPRPGAFYELWLLGADGQLVALGSLQVDDSGSASVDLPLPVDPAQFEFFDLSLEPGDGDPGHSGDSVLRGPTSS